MHRKILRNARRIYMLDNACKLMKMEISEQEQLKSKFEKMRNELSSYDGLLLRGSKKRNVYYFYIQEPGGSRKYLGPESHPDDEKIRKLRYCDEMVNSLQRNIEAMNRFLKEYTLVESSEVLKRIPQLYQLKTSVEMEEDEIQALYQEMKKYKESIPVQYPEDLKISTLDGTMVRSKSEALLYNCFSTAGFYVLYEFPYEYEPGKYVRTDFTLIHPKTGRIVLWEHLGMWFHKELSTSYRRNYLTKTDTYMKLGFVQGINLFVSFETELGIDMERISKDINVIRNQTITTQERKLQKLQESFFKAVPFLKENFPRSKGTDVI